MFPPVYAVVKGSNLYDGMRHFLFIVPPMAVLAGVVLEHLWRATRRIRPGRAQAALAIVFGGACALVSAYHLALLVRLHPVQSVYFNRASGGIPAAYENYDIDYYATSYGATLKLLQRELWNRERDRYLEGPYVITGCWLAAAGHLYAPSELRTPPPTQQAAPRGFLHGVHPQQLPHATRSTPHLRQVPPGGRDRLRHPGRP